MLPVVPMFHANAWGVPYTAAMLGCKMVFPGPHLHPDDLIPLLESEQVTLSCGVPTIWLPMVQILEKNRGKWKLHPGLRLTVGGSAVPEALIRAYAQARHPDHSGLGHDRDVAGRQHLQDHRAAGRLDRGPALRGTGDAGLSAAAGGYPCGRRRRRAAVGRQERGRDPGARPVDHRQLLQPGHARELRRRRLAAHRRRGGDRSAGLHQDHRPHQGPDQVGRRVDQLGRSGERDHGPSGRAGVRRHRRGASQVVRAPARGDRAQAGRAGERSRHQSATWRRSS